MKYIASGAATFSFNDGTKFDLTQGIHENFPDHVKEHWAFSAYVHPLDESDFAKEQESVSLAERVAQLENEITVLKAQLVDKDGEISGMKAQLVAQPSSISDNPASGDIKPDDKETANAKKPPAADK